MNWRYTNSESFRKNHGGNSDPKQGKVLLIIEMWPNHLEHFRTRRPIILIYVLYGNIFFWFISEVRLGWSMIYWLPKIAEKSSGSAGFENSIEECDMVSHKALL